MDWLSQRSSTFANSESQHMCALTWVRRVVGSGRDKSGRYFSLRKDAQVRKRDLWMVLRQGAKKPGWASSASARRDTSSRRADYRILATWFLGE